MTDLKTSRAQMAAAEDADIVALRGEAETLKGKIEAKLAEFTQEEASAAGQRALRGAVLSATSLVRTLDAPPRG